MKGDECDREVVQALHKWYEGYMSVTRVLHKVCERVGECPGICACVQPDDSVKIRWDKVLGQPKQVMTAGTHGLSGQLIFDMGSI